MFFRALVVLLGVVVVQLTPTVGDEDKLHIHIVPHTHDDVGWLKTVDEYYYGGNRSINSRTVKYILDNVIEELQKDEKRTFIYVEIAFFSRWWHQQSDATKTIVKKLVSSGQLEFINGGWCMNDEASTHYNAIIDQMTLGFQFIEENFGPEARPTIAWHVDPFGHSSTQAALFAQMGFDGFFFGRHDYDDHILRINHTRLELMWQPSPSLGSDGDLFTGILYKGYGPPSGFCFDTVCTNDFIQDDPSLDGYNVDYMVKLFQKDIDEIAAAFTTNHIMLTFGSDFRYMNARMNFDNMDKLMKYAMAKNSSFDMFYSTPSRYLKALHDADREWTTKSDDFFPYANNANSFWTGYFTSRPALKGYVRELNSLLQTCSHADAIVAATGGKPSSKFTIRKLQEAMGVAQHHDAVSGTEKQHVANDYAKHLHIGAVDCHGVIADGVGQFLVSNSTAELPEIERCEYLNISICPATETNNFNVIVYNPIGRTRSHGVRVPVTSNNVVVHDSTGKAVPAQISPVSPSVSRVRGKRGNAAYELYFRVVLSGLGFNTFFVRIGSSNSTSSSTMSSSVQNIGQGADDIVIQNKNYQVTVDGTTGRLKMISNSNGPMLKVDQNFLWYNASAGNNKISKQASGAYIFRPNGTSPWDVVAKNSTVKVNLIKGPLFEEIQQTFSDWVQQNIRLHKNSSSIEFDYIMGPIPCKDHLGKEIISRFTTSAMTNKTWYTDANGREMQKRMKDYRATWTYNVTEPVAGNYYPVNSRIFMRFEDASRGSSQFTVMTDRSQGGTSLNDGQLELMVHRRLLHDDKRGVAEPLNETGVDGDGLIIRGKHHVILNDVTTSTQLHREMGESEMLRPHHMFIRDKGSYNDWVKSYMTTAVPVEVVEESLALEPHNLAAKPPKFTALKTELPLNVHLLTFQLMSEGKYLLRLEHQFEKDEQPWNNEVSVSLADLFVFSVDTVTELGLATDTPRTRLQWKTESGPRVPLKNVPVKAPDFTVVLQPMQIRTFQVTAKI